MLYHAFCFVGLWLSLVERSVRDREVAGSNPVNPTIFSPRKIIGACAVVSGAFGIKRKNKARKNTKELLTCAFMGEQKL